MTFAEDLLTTYGGQVATDLYPGQREAFLDHVGPQYLGSTALPEVQVEQITSQPAA